MIDLFKLEPIHSGNTPRGKILRSILKNKPKSVEKINPEFSFVINSQQKLKFQKNPISQPIKLSFNNFKQISQPQILKTTRLNQYDHELSFKNKTSTLFFEKCEDLKNKVLSDPLMRKKTRSVCYTRKQKAQFQLNKYMQSLYLKVHSQRISVQNSKIQTKQRQLRPYARSLKRNIA